MLLPPREPPLSPEPKPNTHNQVDVGNLYLLSLLITRNGPSICAIVKQVVDAYLAPFTEESFLPPRVGV